MVGVGVGGVVGAVVEVGEVVGAVVEAGDVVGADVAGGGTASAVAILTGGVDTSGVPHAIATASSNPVARPRIPIRNVIKLSPSGFTLRWPRARLQNGGPRSTEIHV